MYLYVSKPWLFKTKTSAKRHWPWHWILHLTTSLMQRHSLYMHIINHETTLAGGWGSGQFHKALLISAFPLSGWWFQPSWKILVNGKDYPIYYGKKMFQTINQLWCWSFWWYLWEFAGFLSTSVLAAVKVADVWWHRTPATMMWYYLTLEKAGGAQQIDTQYPKNSHIYILMTDPAIYVWMTNSVTHTHKEKHTHNTTCCPVNAPCQRMSKMLSANNGNKAAIWVSFTTTNR